MAAIVDRLTGTQLFCLLVIAVIVVGLNLAAVVGVFGQRRRKDDAAPAPEDGESSR